MAVPEFFNTIEQSGLSTWLRETDSVFGFYFVLTCHTLGLGMLVGLNAAVDLILLGAAPGVPRQPLRRFFPWMWAGFYINAISGVFLVIAYPTKAFTNPVFYLKLLLIALAVVTMWAIERRVFGGAGASEPVARQSGLSDGHANSAANGRALAGLSLVLWLGAITAGRLLAYTYTYRLYGVLRSALIVH